MKNYPPVGEAEGKKQDVEQMFDAIAPRYDLLNRVLSMGIDQWWRKRAVAMLKSENPRDILDVATGTADLALEALSLDPAHVVGIDISEEMLAYGREKISRRGEEHRVVLQTADAENLPFEDASFDAAMVAFGVRNFENLLAGLQDIRRVLRPGGVLIVLEFSQPTVFPVKQAYQLYSRHVLPRIGRAVSQNEGAYQYLPDSVAAFPSGEDFLERMRTSGYADLAWKPLTFGIASLYKGRK